MPKTSNSVNVMGGGMNLTDLQKQRISNYQTWLPYHNKSKEIVVVSPQNWDSVVKTMTKATNRPSAFTFGNMGRTYINGALLDKPDNDGRSLEWILAHEAAHLNSPLTPKQQEAQDSGFDEDAENTVRLWNDKVAKENQNFDKGRSVVQSQISKLPGEFQPIQSQPPALLSSDSLLPHAHAAILGALGAASQPTVKQQ